MSTAAVGREVRVYADEEEQKAMALCHPRSIEVLKKLIGTITQRSLFRALDVAGGDGRLSKDFLLKQYRKVDHFDQCPTGVKKAKAALLRSPNFGHTQQAKMQDYGWRFEYSGIFMVWCSGYLARSELVSFLRKAKTRLMTGRFRTTRHQAPESFIILLDNVREDGEPPAIIKSQRVRSELELETIFEEAGLLIHKRSEREPMPGGHKDVVVWALY